MIASGNPLFLDLSTGSVSGHPTPAGGSLGGRGNLIKNSLLDGSTLIDPAAIAAARAAGEVGGSGAPTTTEAAPSVSSIPGTAALTDHPLTERGPVNLARTSRRRLALTLFAVFAIVGIFVVRLVDLQVVRADDLMKAADQRTTRSDILYGTRGSIVDANGVILADSVDRFDITAAPVNVKPEGFDRSFTKDGQTTTTHVSLADAISEISAATGVDTKTLTDAVTADPKSNFAYLAKGVKLDVLQRGARR